MKLIHTLFFAMLSIALSAQSASLSGVLQDPDGGPVLFANVALYSSTDSTLVKVETSDEAGVFRMRNITAGSYFLTATYVGLPDLIQPGIQLTAGQETDLGILTFQAQAVELEAATVTASRAMVEIKPDRTVFNVQGTINSTGDNGLSLLRKAPGVTVDNNDNINVLGRAGVLLYVDGKRLPLTGDDLSNYLQNLPAEQIDRIDIITSPGAKYEAEGNAGIIDIRLKKDKSVGANGSLSSTVSQGRRAVMNLNGSGNYRNKTMNVFGSAGIGDAERWHEMEFSNQQNGLQLEERNVSLNDREYYDARLGTDFFLSKQHTLGFLISTRSAAGDNRGFNRIAIANQNSPSQIDSILVSDNTTETRRDQYSFNLNYRFDNAKGRSLNFDADYGMFSNDILQFQPNLYYNASENEVLTEVINSFDTPTDIDIYTLKVDYEDKLMGGVVGFGGKFSRVVSDNTFLFKDVVDDVEVVNNTLSNRFNYEENVYAAYVSYNRPITEKLSFSAGVRAEQTDAVGNLVAFLPELQEPPVDLEYINWFPNAGLSWQAAPMHTFNLNYGRRINRPDYNVLNPFNSQLSQLSYRKGNPFLRPEIVNNLELGYTLKYRYNFKIGYSRTLDQITRLIAPDEEDDRAGFITWENLANQTIYSVNVSAPIQVTKGWNAYFNAGGTYLDNQAEYENGGIVDIQVFTFNMYQQHTFDLPGGFKGEISGFFTSPGVWGGVFKYDALWSLNAGLQRKFLQDRLNVRFSINDIFFQSGWEGVSEFNGLVSTGFGNHDSRRASLSLSYNFGKQTVKSARKRKTGLEDEAGRVGE